MNKDISVLFELNQPEVSFEEILIDSYTRLSELNELVEEINTCQIAQDNLEFICANYKKYKKDPVFHELVGYQFASSQEAFAGLSKAMQNSIEKINEFIQKFFEWVDVTFGLICKNAVSVIDKYQKILKLDDTADKLKAYETTHERISVYTNYLTKLIAYSRNICETINGIKNVTNPEDTAKIDEFSGKIEEFKRNKEFEAAREAYDKGTAKEHPDQVKIEEGGWMSESNIMALKDAINNCSSARQNVMRYKSTVTQIFNNIKSNTASEQKSMNKSKHDLLKDLLTQELSDCIKGMNKLVTDSSKKIQQLIKVASGKSETEVK